MKNTFVKNLLVLMFALCMLGLASCQKNSQQHQQQQPQEQQPTTQEQQTTQEPQHEHAFGEWNITKEATLNEEGSKERTCACGEVETQTVVTTPTSAGLKYTVNDDGTSCTIRGIGTCKDTKIIIGQTIDNYRITAISLDAFFNCDKITSVTIADSVTSIGSSAFSYCTSL